jgi:hypothetical protein
MKYPSMLVPTTMENLELPSGIITPVPKVFIAFNPWTGEKITDTYGGKPILNFKGRPAFAELAILRIFQLDGWDGVWVDTYRKKFRTEYWPRNEVDLPEPQNALLGCINKQADSGRGCWDVFCWKGETIIFSEVKHKGRDRIRQTQLQWLESAFTCGLEPISFLVVEWKNASHQNTTA